MKAMCSFAFETSLRAPFDCEYHAGIFKTSGVKKLFTAKKILNFKSLSVDRTIKVTFPCVS